MGYDMTIVNTPEDEAVTTKEAETVFSAAVKERDALTVDRDHPDHVAAQANVENAYEAMSAADASYFRLNVWGMSRYREFMEQLGMVYSESALPPWPDVPDGLSYEDVEAAEAPADGSNLPVRPEAMAYVKQRDAYVAWHSEPAFGIALHKFGSNDGWLVTPEEIAAALESYRTHAGDEVKVIVNDSLDYWLKWIAYLERAQRRGGFHVW